MWSLLIDLESNLKATMLRLFQTQWSRASTLAMSNAVRITLAAYVAALEGNHRRVDAIYRLAWGDTKMRRFIHDVAALAASSASPKAPAQLARVLGYAASRFRTLDAGVLAGGLVQLDDACRAAQLISMADAFECGDGAAAELARVRAAVRTVPAYSGRELEFRVACLEVFNNGTVSSNVAEFRLRGVALEEELLAKAARVATNVTARAALRGELMEDVLQVALPSNERFRWAVEIFDPLAADYRDAENEEGRLEAARVMFEHLALLFPKLAEVGQQLVDTQLKRLLPARAAGQELRLSVLVGILQQAGESVSARQLRETHRAEQRTTRRSRR